VDGKLVVVSVEPKADIAGSGRPAIGSAAVDGLDILRLRELEIWKYRTISGLT